MSRGVQAAISEQAFSGQDQPDWWAVQLAANFAAPHTRQSWRREGALFDPEDLDPAPIPRPILVVHGQDDLLAPPAIGEWLHEHARDSRILRVEGGSHMLPITHADLLADRMAAFVRGRLTMGRTYVTPATFRFLRELATHNDRDWFARHKERYHEEVRDPLLAFVTAFGPKLAKISKHMVADPRPVGGSLFRIYRDTRFSKDKSPYKTHAGLSFRHVRGRDVHGPVFYLHFEPGRVFSAAGMWHPPSEALKQLRDAIVEHPERWKKVARSRSLSLDEGDPLKRPPRGYDAEHPFVEDLKRRSFTASTSFNQAEACAPDFLERFARACRQKAPLMEFITTSVGLRW